MPRRNRNRRNRRKNHKKPQNGANLQNQSTKAISIQETPHKSNSKVFLTLPDTSPLSTPSAPSLRRVSSYNALKCRSNSLVNTPPVHTKKNNEITGTNLSKLFNADDKDIRQDPSYNNVTPKRSGNFRKTFSRTESYINNLSGSMSMANVLGHRKMQSRTIRSNSSISKLHSPGLDKIPIMVDVATQTVYFDNRIERAHSFDGDDRSDVYLQSCINIFETPKISQMEKLERFDFNSIKESNLKDKTFDNTKVENLKYFQDLNESVPKTYVSPKIIERNYKEGDDDEISIFSSHLTPIEKLQKTDQIIENLAKNILNAQLDRKHFPKANTNIGNYFSTPKTPNNKNINNRFEDKIWTQRISKLNSCVSKRRIYNSVSPRKLKDIPGKLFNNSRKSPIITKSQSPDILPKSFTPHRMSFSKSNNILNMSNTNIYARFMTNIKNLHSKYSQNWLGTITDLCRYLGITIRKRMSTLCTTPSTDDKEPAVQQATAVNNKICETCEEYKAQIVSLTYKVGTLDKEMCEEKEKMINLHKEIGKIQGELREFDTIKKRIEDMEQKFEQNLLRCPPTLMTPQPPPAPPIPPPPPPPMPSSTPSLSSNLRNVRATNKKTEKRNCENSRPVISLDDILNVKLKKTSDKPTVSRRNTQPFISVEMLNQIKLRPTSRPQTPSSLKEVSSPSSLSLSPATSLTRILSNVDPNVRRIKRLRRIGRYSLDDSRKHLLKRERNEGDS